MKAYIFADVGKVTIIRYMDDNGWCRGALEKDTPKIKIVKRKFVTVEERRIEDEKNKPQSPVTYDEGMARRAQRQKERRDSMFNEALQRNREQIRQREEKARLENDKP